MRILIPIVPPPFAYRSQHGASMAETLTVLTVSALLSDALAPQLLSLITPFIVG